MDLVLDKKDFVKIKNFLFMDSLESMIVGTCRKISPRRFRLDSLYFPEAEDFKTRGKNLVSVKIEKAYPILKKISLEKDLSLVQIHNHTSLVLPFFSPVDDRHNRENLEDLSRFSKKARFFRLLFTPGTYLGEYNAPRIKKFKPLKIRISG